MLSPFHLEKSIQATAALLATSTARRMSRLRVLKLLYVAERESLKETGRTITGDRVVAMDHGPVLTAIYNLIKGEHADASRWNQFFSRDDQHDIQLIAEPGNGKLSRYELSKLSAVAKRFEDANDWDLVEYTHEFEEWKKNVPQKGACKKIPLDDVLAALKMLDQKASLQRDAWGLASAHKLMSSR
jgi:uncharacterized phage-associated protein